MTEPGVSQLMSVAEAIAILDGVVVSPRMIRMTLAEALGLRVAEEVRADRDSPPFDKSQMDGFAVRAADVSAAGAELERVGRVAAGESFSGEMKPGQAVAIMTGAPLPRGADAVIPVEHSRHIGEERVRFDSPATAGRFVAKVGSEMRAGEVVLSKGMKLEAPQIAAAASVGAAEVSVFAAPSVAVLSTGDELVGIGQAPSGAQIRSSNNAMLCALLRRWGCDVTDLGFARDEKDAIRAAIERGSSGDVLLVSGGMSMGERDYVPMILREIGARILVSKLRIKPGKPFVFARMPGGQFVFGLPGNPVSAFVCTVRLASRLLTRMAGGEPSQILPVAKLKRAVEANGAREFYQPAWFDGRAIEPLAWRSSADLLTLARANALLVRAENDPARGVGDEVEFLGL